GNTIAAVGVAVKAPSDAKVIDVSGKTITPGIIDTHSHIGVYASPGFTAHADGNEMVSPTTPQVRAEDGYWPQDPQIERARAGGVTTMQILPGSANLIGGRSVVVKTYPHARRVDEARFAGAPFGLKIACGENPKRTYGKKGGPGTRMGNMAGFRGKFQAAKEYQRSWDRYRTKLARYKKGGKRKAGSKDEMSGPPDPPARDFGLETMVGVLEGRVLVHNHCYRADEMALMMRLAEEFGFRIRSFHHAVEAYKIADLLAEHGASASMWADWWGFKAEAFDGIRENAAMVAAAGARAIIHSDSAEGVQRLNQEAAKAMWAGRRAGLTIPDDEALRWITANPAWALGVSDSVGTVEVGKLADLVVWDGDPLSVYTHAERVLLEGKTIYRRGLLTPHSDFESGWRSSGNPLPTTATRPPTAATGNGAPLSFDGASTPRPPALTFAGCTIHTGDGRVLKDAAITTKGTRVATVGPPGVSSADDANTTMPPQPCVITPGFISAGSALGLVEIGAEDGTKDDSRTGKEPIRAGYDASVAVNADSSLLGVNRAEGITSAAVTPQGGMLAGQFAWIDLVKGEHRTIVARPRVAVAGTLSTGVVQGSRAAALSLLDRTFADARFWRSRGPAYDRRQSRDLVAHPSDLAALLPVLDGQARLVMNANRASDILALIDLAKRESVGLTILGAAQGYKVADELAAAGVVVVVQPSRNLPGNLDRLGASMDNAARLHAAGVTVAIAALGSAHNARNVAQEAGIAIANGFPRDAAVTAVTHNVARAYGMDGEYGTLGGGKVANFVVWRGDPFELSTVPEAVIIRGRSVPLTSRQSELRERYRDLSKFTAAKR
ncbi:MAG: amidohydrolase family protein, partial [Myxococcota bacterium]